MTASLMRPIAVLIFAACLARADTPHVPAGDPRHGAQVPMTTTAAQPGSATEPSWRVLPEDEAKTMVFAEIMARTRRYAAAMPVCRSLEAWRRRAASLRPQVLRALGLDPLPERTPLNVRLLGEKQLDGYRIQRLTFESRPGFLVTANVYVPDGQGPFPLVLCPVGHWLRGKNEPVAAARSHALAKLGYITITYDPFGQEERAIPGNEHVEAWRLLLTGHTNMSLMVWDTVRALDTMLSRPDVDPKRIACTGASGGGLNTLYYSVADDRLDVAVPVVYITQWADLLGTGVQHCPCSHIPGLGAFTDMGEMTALFAPKPQLYINAKADPQFTTAGAEHAEAQARVVYDLYGAGDKLLLRCFEGDHDYSRPMRETLYGFLAQHLLGQGDGRPIPEPTFTPESPEAEWCFPTGKIPTTTKTARQLALEWAEAAAAGLPSPKAFRARAVTKALREAVHPPRMTKPVVKVVGTLAGAGVPPGVRKLRIQVQPGITLPALFAPAPAGAPAVVIADCAPDASRAGALLRSAREAGFSALYVAPRGTGETAWDEHVICTDNLLLGDSILGQRAFDLAQARRALGSLPEAGGAPVGLVALGPEAGLYGLFAQALWGEFDAVSVGPMMSTYLEAFGPGIPMAAYVNRILFAADIPHVAALAAARPLQLSFAHDECAARYPQWAQYLDQHATLTDGLSVERALGWMKTHPPSRP